MRRILGEVIAIAAPTTSSIPNTKSVLLNANIGRSIPAIPLQNVERSWAGTVRVATIRPCIRAGDFAKANPRSIALMMGNGSPINELAINIAQY